MRRIYSVGLGFLVFLAGALAAHAAESDKREVLPDAVLPLHYDVQLSPDAATLSFRGKVTITVMVATPVKDIIVNADGLTFDHASEEAASRASLAPQQHQALLAIKGAGGELSIGDLAKRLLVRPHSAVGLVDRLVEEKLVRRESDQKDRRRILLTLTPTAERVLETLTAAHRDEIGRVAPLLQSLLSELEK